MKAFTGRIWKFGDDINTDLMYPHFVHTLPEAEQPKYCFSANRPGWSAEVRSGDIIVGGRNFGAGSSRPAARSLRALGVACVLADSMNGLFMRNSLNFGLPALPVPGISSAFDEPDIAEVDLVNGNVRNQRTGRVIELSPLPPLLLDIVEQGGMMSVLRKRGYVK